MRMHVGVSGCQINLFHGLLAKKNVDLCSSLLITYHKSDDRGCTCAFSALECNKE